MKHLLISAAAIALLAGCGGKKDATDAVDAGSKAVASASRDFGKISDIKLASGDPAKAADALSALSLADSGSGKVAFGDSALDGAKATFTDVVISGDDADHPLKAGKLEFSGLDMTAAGASFSKMHLADITIEAEDEDDPDVNIADIQLLNPSPELAAWVASAMGKGEPADFPAVDKLSFDALTLNNLSIEGTDSSGESGMIKVSGITLQGMGNDTLALASIDGIKMDINDGGETVKANLGKMAIYGADYDFVKDIQALGDDPDEDEVMKVMMTSMYAEGMDPPYDGMVIDDMSFDAEGISFAIPSMDAVVQRDKQGRMVGSVMKPMTMTLKADPEGGEGGAELAGALSQLGYKEIVMKMESNGKYDPDKDIYSFAGGKNYFELKDGMKMSFGGKIEGYSDYSKAYANAMTNMDGGEPDMEAMQGAFEKLTIHNFELTLDDDSLVDRMFTLAASQSGEDPKQLRNQTVMMMGMAPMMAQGSGADMELIQEGVGALTKFIQEPGTLTIKVAPKTPLNLGTIEDPAALTKEALGFSASVK